MCLEQKKVHCGYGEKMVSRGDRFVWHTFKWYVVDFTANGTSVRLDGTADVTVLPDHYVAELIDDFHYLSNSWR
jgi:hypothetical protein